MSGKNIGIVLAGGIGSRFGSGKPKQYFPILGKEMIAYSIELFRAAKMIDDFVVVLNREEFENGRIARQYGVKVIPGGATRNHSFKAAMDWIEANHPDCEKIIENNAACPLTLPQWIDEMLELLDDFLTNHADDDIIIDLGFLADVEFLVVFIIVERLDQQVELLLKKLAKIGVLVMDALELFDDAFEQSDDRVDHDGQLVVVRKGVGQ